jgi:hypothetical protein
VQAFSRVVTQRLPRTNSFVFVDSVNLGSYLMDASGFSAMGDVSWWPVVPSGDDGVVSDKDGSDFTGLAG